MDSFSTVLSVFTSSEHEETTSSIPTDATNSYGTNYCRERARLRTGTLTSFFVFPSLRVFPQLEVQIETTQRSFVPNIKLIEIKIDASGIYLYSEEIAASTEVALASSTKVSLMMLTTKPPVRSRKSQRTGGDMVGPEVYGAQLKKTEIVAEARRRAIASGFEKNQRRVRRRGHRNDDTVPGSLAKAGLAGRVLVGGGVRVFCASTSLRRELSMEGRGSRARSLIHRVANCKIIGIPRHRPLSIYASTKQLRLDPTLYEAIPIGDVTYVEANTGVKMRSLRILVQQGPQNNTCTTYPTDMQEDMTTAKRLESHATLETLAKGQQAIKEYEGHHSRMRVAVLFDWEQKLAESSPMVYDEKVCMHDSRDPSLRSKHTAGADERRGWGSTGASGVSDHTEVGAKSQDASGEVTRRGQEMAEQRQATVEGRVSSRGLLRIFFLIFLGFVLFLSCGVLEFGHESGY
ncbi:hypothetical protein OG21DRAFT_1607692 [Imleria badia]|nr:hypothetical protein OG21DRAFT_1607692 [Imleria badia]